MHSFRERPGDLADRYFDLSPTTRMKRFSKMQLLARPIPTEEKSGWLNRGGRCPGTPQGLDRQKAEHAILPGMEVLMGDKVERLPSLREVLTKESKGLRHPCYACSRVFFR